MLWDEDTAATYDTLNQRVVSYHFWFDDSKDARVFLSHVSTYRLI